MSGLRERDQNSCSFDLSIFHLEKLLCARLYSHAILYRCNI